MIIIMVYIIFSQQQLRITTLLLQLPLLLFMVDLSSSFVINKLSTTTTTTISSTKRQRRRRYHNPILFSKNEDDDEPRTTNFGMPFVGFGTYLMSKEETYGAVLEALNIGYKHIDTAESYKNEIAVGNAIEEYLQSRRQSTNDIFVTTKFWPGRSDWNQPIKVYKDVVQSCTQSLHRLQLECIDLYMPHIPVSDPSSLLEQYNALLKLQHDGKIKNIGVSNYGINHLQTIQNAGLPPPVVNQIELSPIVTQSSELLTFMEDHNIQAVAYSSLAPLSSWRADTKHDEKTMSQRAGSQEVISDMAHKLQISEAQLLYRWGLQKQYAIVAKSKTPLRIKQNFDLYGFHISPDDMKILDSFDKVDFLAWAVTNINPMSI
jgi:2,5-diketo-D-gluconate reductase A